MVVVGQVFWLLLQRQKVVMFYTPHPCPQDAQLLRPLSNYSRFGCCHQMVVWRTWKDEVGCRCVRQLFSIELFLGTVWVSSSPHPSTNILKCLVLEKKAFQSYKYGLWAAVIQNTACTTQNIIEEGGAEAQYVSRQEECRKITGYTSCGIITQ